jgi:HEAT repeat protein
MSGTRRFTIVTVVAGLAAASGARADRELFAVNASPEIVDALTGIDFVAQKPTLDPLLGPTPIESLTQLASTQADVSPGIRLRALRALALYPSQEARDVLVAHIHAHAPASSGIEVLQLRTAVEALGLIGMPDDVADLVPLLDKEDSRDVRAAAARALRDIGATSAIAPLRARLGKETVPQVQFAISDALRVLSGTPP